METHWGWVDADGVIGMSPGIGIARGSADLVGRFLEVVEGEGGIGGGGRVTGAHEPFNNGVLCVQLRVISRRPFEPVPHVTRSSEKSSSAKASTACSPAMSPRRRQSCAITLMRP